MSLEFLFHNQAKQSYTEKGLQTSKDW